MSRNSLDVTSVSSIPYSLCIVAVNVARNIYGDQTLLIFRIITKCVTYIFSACLFRYLTLVEGAHLYAIVRDSSKAVVSLPPVTNSERSKVRLTYTESLM